MMVVSLPFGRSGQLALACVLAVVAASPASAETWRGLAIEPEHRCSQYRSKDYAYPQSVELEVIAGLGKIFSPYTGECFRDRGQTDIEHIVARSEAHDSGLCRADRATRKRFASDPLNLTLASPAVNRGQKKAYDATGWMPARNRCWFANRVLQVRLKYKLSIDRREADALEAVLARCTSTALETTACRTTVELPDRTGGAEALRRWDDNRNGRITCKEARRHGIAPVPRGHPAYPFMRDGDGDGVVCE